MLQEKLVVGGPAKQKCFFEMSGTVQGTVCHRIFRVSALAPWFRLARSVAKVSRSLLERRGDSGASGRVPSVSALTDVRREV